MVDSGTYGPEVLARRYAMAQQLLAEPKQPVRHWAEGLNELAKGALGGYQQNEAENLEQKSRYDAYKLIANRLGETPDPPPEPKQSGFAKIAALFNPKPADAPVQSDVPAAPVFRGNSQGAPAGMAPPIPSAAIPVADRIVNAESGGDPNAKNPRSSATGAGQFIDSTWLDTVKKSNPQLAAGKTDAELLALRSNPDISRSMTAAYAASNGDHLKNNGIDPTPGNTYLAHFAGPAGATAILKADPATPIGSIVGQQAMIANLFLKNMTAGDLRSWADKRMGGGNPLANAPAVNGNGPSPLDTAQWPAGPINAPGQPVDGNQPSPLDTAQYPAGPVGAPSAASVDNAVLPPNAQPAQARPIQAGPTPGILGGQPSAAATPPVGPTGAAPAGLAGNQNAAKIAALLTNPWIDPSVKTQVLTQLNPTYGFQTSPDGTIMRTNPKTGQVEPVYQAPAKMTAGVVGKDRNGNDIHGFLDPANKKAYDISGNPITSSNTMAGGNESPLNGPEYLKTLPQDRQNLITGMLEGRIAPLQLGRYGNAGVQSLLLDAAKVEPGFDTNLWTQRNKTTADFAPSGKSGQNVTSLNTVVGHLGDLMEKSDALKNVSGIPLANEKINDLKNWYNKNSGDPAVTNFNIARNAVSDEMAKVFRSSGMSDSEIRQWKDNLSSSFSPEQMRGAIKTGIGLMDSRLAALADARSRGMSKTFEPRDLMNDKSKATLQKLETWVNGGDAKEAALANPQGSQPSSQAALAEKTINGKTYYKFGPNPTDWAEK